jgi:acetyltransferase-like isoleucine patch superfamily enzyme
MIEKKGRNCWLKGTFRNGTILSKKGIILGNNVMVYPQAYILTKPKSGNIIIGDGVNILVGTYIGGEKIKIGKNVLIGSLCSIVSTYHDHNRTDVPMKYQQDKFKPVVIEDDVWIGTHATILPGVTIGKGSIIGAGTVVTKNIPPYSIAVGVPAKVIKKRKILFQKSKPAKNKNDNLYIC